MLPFSMQLSLNGQKLNIVKCFSDSISHYGLFDLIVIETAIFQRALLLQLWKFNLTTHKWSLQKTTGVMPVELASHSGRYFSISSLM